MSEKMISIELHQRSDYQFDIQFGAAVPDLLCDEPEPLGQGLGPSPVQLLAAAVGNCLSDSFLFACRKYKQSPEPLRTVVTAVVGRNDQGRQRVLGMSAQIHLGVAANQVAHLARVLQQYEAFCTVTQSVGLGIPVNTQVIDAGGEVLTAPPSDSVAELTAPAPAPAPAIAPAAVLHLVHKARVGPALD